MFFAPEYPCRWRDEGPFGIWYHPDGHEIVNIEPGYVLTRNDGTEQTFDDLYVAMESIKDILCN